MASLIAHALAFTFFKIVYRRLWRSCLPRRASGLISPDSKRAATLLRWIEAERSAGSPSPRSGLRRRGCTPCRKCATFPRYLAKEAGLERDPPIGCRSAHAEFAAAGRLCDSFTSQLPPAMDATPTTVSFFQRARCLGASDSAAPNFCSVRTTSRQRTSVFALAVGSRGRCSLLLSPEFVRRSGPG